MCLTPVFGERSSATQGSERGMPIYEYYCPKCGSKFEELRPLARADAPATCARGHSGATRTLSMFAVSRGADGSVMTMEWGGGGSCACGGGGCGCGH